MPLESSLYYAFHPFIADASLGRIGTLIEN